MLSVKTLSMHACLFLVYIIGLQYVCSSIVSIVVYINAGIYVMGTAHTIMIYIILNTRKTRVKY